MPIRNKIKKSIVIGTWLLIVILTYSLLNEKIFAEDNVVCGIYSSNNTGRRWLDNVEGYFGPVIYPAYKHENIKCNICHHPEKANQYICKNCHYGKDLKIAFHILCRGCHEKEHKGPIECIACHEKSKYKPDIIIIKEFKKSKREVLFPHEAHWNYVNSCRDCHHKDLNKIEHKCSYCHYERANDKAIEAKEAYHKLCKDCHKKNKKGPIKCDDCHQKL